jgi:hypothetical protein
LYNNNVQLKIAAQLFNVLSEVDICPVAVF